MLARLAGCAVAAVLCVSTALAQAPGQSQGQSQGQAQLAPREEPAKTLPVPGTVSPGMQAIIAQPLRANWAKPPTTLANTAVGENKSLSVALVRPPLAVMVKLG